MAVEILRVQHCNVNCSDLSRSLDFYCELIGLEPLHHTNPIPQPGEAFGLAGSAQWDAWILHDGRGLEAPAVDLLQWIEPVPTGRPYRSPRQLGIARLAFCVPDAGAQREKLERAGVACLGSPLTALSNPGLATPAVIARDPDGTLLEFVEGPGPSTRFVRVDVNCSDVARSRDWYERVLGLEPEPHEGMGPPEVARLHPPGSEFTVRLVQCQQPATDSGSTPYAEANHLGIYRMAFLVEDVRASCEELQNQGVACPPAVFLDMGPEIPVDGVWAAFFPDPDGSCLELIEMPKLTE